MVDGLSLSLVLELDCLSSDVGFVFVVRASAIKMVINSCTKKKHRPTTSTCGIAGSNEVIHV